MPSPIAHMAAGVAIHRFRFGKPSGSGRDRALLAACIGLSLLPDVDAAIGIAAGNLGRYHNNFAGSPAFGVLVALAVAAVVGVVRRPLARPALALVLICYQMHVLMDFLTVSRGTMLLWPLSTERFSPPLHLFYGLRWSHGMSSTTHFVTLASELVFVVALAGLVRFVERRRIRGRGAAADPIEDRA